MLTCIVKPFDQEIIIREATVMILKLSNQYDQEHIYTCEKIKQH